MIGDADVAKLVEKPSALFAYVGQYLNLSCRATGDPSPTSTIHYDYVHVRDTRTRTPLPAR